MELMTYAEFAKKNNVSYESVRKLASKHMKALQGHVVTQDRTRYLDAWAVNYLEEQRRKARLVVIHEDQRDEIEALQQQADELREKLEAATQKYTELMTAHIQTQQQLIEAQAAAMPALELREKLALREKELKEKDTELLDAQKKLDELREEDGYIISTLRKERDEAKTEADSFRPSLFGFYRKK